MEDPCKSERIFIVGLMMLEGWRKVRWRGMGGWMKVRWERGVVGDVDGGESGWKSED